MPVLNGTAALKRAVDGLYSRLAVTGKKHRQLPLARRGEGLISNFMIELTFLGTGTSNGVPVIGCSCAVCTSDDPRDKRGRTSAVVRYNGKSVLIDTATELRLQALTYGVDSVDAVLFTHPHADHTGGFDDLRRYNELQAERLPIYAGPETAATLLERFAYAFTDQFPFFGGKPDLTMHQFDGPFGLYDETIVPILVLHGRMRVHGYRIGPLAYVTDAKVVPEKSVELLNGVDVLVLNALRERPHPTHLSIREAVELIERIGPREAYLIHLSHEISHVEASAMVPAGVQIAYDGLTIRTGEHLGHG
jgi:phosphoribosyl 1,2-cyclic phosphate phosphodiesterase